MIVRVDLVMVIGMSTASATPDKERFTADGHAITASLFAESTKVIVGEPVLLQLRVAKPQKR